MLLKIFLTCALVNLLATPTINRSNINIRNLPDGIDVSHGSNLSILAGQWTILLTITEPGIHFRDSERSRLIQRVNGVRQIIQSVSANPLFTSKRKNILLKRLLLMKQDNTIHFDIQSKSDTRRKRGLINFGGYLLNKIFGTATEKQITQVQEQLVLASKGREAISHNVGQLISVVNQTRMEASQTRQHLQALEVAHNRFINAEKTRWRNTTDLLQLMVLEDMVDNLFTEYLGLQRELDTIDKLHDTLRRGLLTEAICPPELIDEISKLADSFGLEALPTNWYYQNVRITPLIMIDGQMTYEVKLPYIDQALYVRYTITTYPVPLNSSGLTVKIMAEQDIAMHTSDNYWFVPKNCFGFNPELCHTGPVYGEGTYQCERGIITQFESDSSKCPLIRTFLEHTEAAEIGLGLYVIWTKGEKYDFVCPGKTVVTQTMQMGTYMITLPARCTLSGKNWILKGTIRQFIDAVTTIKSIPLKPLKLSKIMPTEWNDLTQFQVNPDGYDTFGKPANNFVDMVIYDSKKASHFLAWINIGLIIILAIIMIALGRYAYIHRKEILPSLKNASSKLVTKCFGRKSKPDPRITVRMIDNPNLELTKPEKVETRIVSVPIDPYR